LEFVTSLAFADASHLAPIAQAADEAGFDYVTLSDHVVHPERLRTPYPYTEDGERRWPAFTAWPDPWVAIAHMAAVTARLRFYTSVYVPAIRSPFQVAKTVGTAAVLSNDRVALGVGAGWSRDEFELMEQPFDGRGKRLDEIIEVCRKLWAGGWVEHHGDHYDFDRLEMSPAPESSIPVFVGGFAKPALRRAATIGDGWISDLHTRAELEELIPEVLRLRAEAGRGRDDFTILVSCSDVWDLDGYRALEELGATHLVTFPWVFYGAADDDVQAKVDGIRRFADDVVMKLR
jgi:probable F420-dependent oxidoreductase